MLLLLLFAGVVKIPLFLHPQLAVADASEGPLYALLVRWIGSAGRSAPLVFSGLAFTLLVVQALLLNYFFSSQKMLNRSTDLPGMSYLLITSLQPQWSYWSAPLLYNTILLYLLVVLFNLYNRPEARAALFNMGFVVGLSAFLHPSSLLLTLWLLPAIAIMRPFRLQEAILALLGVVTPFYFYGVWLFLTDRLSWSQLSPISLQYPRIGNADFWNLGLLLLAAIPLLVGIYYVQDNTRKMLIQVRRGWTILFLLLLVTLSLPFFNNGTVSGWMPLLIPLAFYHACFYLLSGFRIVPLLFFWVSFFFVLAGQFSGSGWTL